MYCLVFCFKFYFGFFWWSSSLQQVFGHVSLSTLCAFFKSRKDKGPWQGAGLTETTIRLPSDSIWLNEVCTTTSLIWVKRWIENYETWFLVYLFALYTFSLLPDPASQVPKLSQSLKSESIWIFLLTSPFVPLLRFTTFDLESWSPLAMVSLANYCQKTHLF
jgi:hypothetical protein